MRRSCRMRGFTFAPPEISLSVETPFLHFSLPTMFAMKALELLGSRFSFHLLVTEILSTLLAYGLTWSEQSKECDLA